MFFSRNPAEQFYEQMMVEIPNFYPRSHGIHVYKCIEQNSSLQEKIKNGEAKYKEVITETMKAIRFSPFEQRLNQYLEESEEKPMKFRSEKHREIFSQAIRKKDKRNYALMAAIYLLASDIKLWNIARQHINKASISFNSIKLKGIHENGYILFCGAKDLYSGTKHLCVGDLADSELIPKKIFGLLCNAMAIRRFGLSSLNNADEK